MKKFLFVSMVVILLLIPTLAFADMGAPSFIVYSGYVSNPDGAPYFKTTSLEEEPLGTLPFKTKIICYSSYDDYRLAFVLENENFSYENNSTKYINKYNVTINDLTKYSLGDKQEARTFANTVIYDMPTAATEGKVLGMIPSETDIIIQPYRVNEEETGLWNDWTQWYYTSYNDINGWIKINNFGFHYKSGDLVTDKNMLTNDGLFVPILTHVTDYYGFGGEQYSVGRFYYEDELVEVNLEEDFAYKVDKDDEDVYSYEILFDGVSLYEQANVKSKKVVDSLPIGTILNAEYVVYGHAFETWIGVRYEGSIAWMYNGELFSYRNKAVAEKTFVSNRELLNNARANNWEWTDEEDYPTDYEGLKKYYDNHIEDGLKYAEEVIEESDAKRLVSDKKEKIVDVESGEKVGDMMPSIRPSDSSLGTNEMVVAVVAIIAFVVVVVATLVTVIVLVMKKRK